MARLIHPAMLFVLLLGSIAAAPSAQEPGAPVLSVRTDLVTLVVTVVDHRGTLVTGLRPEHFTVYDNGERQTIQFFTAEQLPATIGLVVDRSGSMRRRCDEMSAVAEAFAAMRHPLDEAFAFSFNEVVWPGLTASAGGMTALYDALDRGLERVGRGTRDRKALIAVSDGGDNASERSLAGVLDRARRTEAPIYAVTLFDPDNRDARPQVLKALARETGGRVFVAKRPEDVMRSFAQIAQDIRTGYTIGFAPPETAAGGFRSIRVLVDAGNDRRLTARTRAGYHARRSPETAK